MNANWSETIWRISCAAASPALGLVISKISYDQKGRRKYARYIPSMCASVVGSSTRHQPPLRASLTRLFPRIEQSAAQPCDQRTGQLGRTQLVCACEEPYPAGFNFGKLLRPLDLSMQKHTAKIRFDEGRSPRLGRIPCLHSAHKRRCSHDCRYPLGLRYRDV